MLVKMPHSNFTDKAYEFNSGIGKCPCGQTFKYTSERDMKMKLRMHLRFCSNPPIAFDKCTFRILGGWQAMSLGGGVTVMEKREILAGWVTKVCLKCTKKAGVGMEGDI